jgi:hypothetical protein
MHRELVPDKQTHGHFTHYYAAVWKPYLIRFMGSLGRPRRLGDFGYDGSVPRPGPVPGASLVLSATVKRWGVLGSEGHHTASPSRLWRKASSRGAQDSFKRAPAPPSLQPARKPLAIS